MLSTHTDLGGHLNRTTVVFSVLAILALVTLALLSL